jgi:uncharacterized protein
MRVGGFKVIRDPLWNNIQIDRHALAIIDTEPFQRLRYVRQLGHAYLVYPGATHTRFEHALGTYHLAGRALAILRERGVLDPAGEEPTVVRLAALLHDIGHYPFSHALEEAGLPSHETLADHHLSHPELQEVIAHLGIPGLHQCLTALIDGSSTIALGGLISGSLDLDKIEYLTRDARMCGVPYGNVDVDRLLHALSIVSIDDRQSIGIHEKGLSALESLLFARYQMYRNVYWHHAVRSATAMFKRVVRISIAAGHVDPSWIPHATDETLMDVLRQRSDSEIGSRLRRRHLYKRVIELSSREVPNGCGDWISEDPDLLHAVENQIARELQLGEGQLLIDFPRKSKMLEVDMPLLRSDGTVELLSGTSAGDILGIQGVADELHANARMLRVFMPDRHPIDVSTMLQIVERSPAQLRADLSSGDALLQ